MATTAVQMPATGRSAGLGTEPAGQGHQYGRRSVNPAAHNLARPGDYTAGQGVPGPVVAQCRPPPTSHALYRSMPGVGSLTAALRVAFLSTEDQQDCKAWTERVGLAPVVVGP